MIVRRRATKHSEVIYFLDYRIFQITILTSIIFHDFFYQENWSQIK